MGATIAVKTRKIESRGARRPKEAPAFLLGDERPAILFPCFYHDCHRTNRRKIVPRLGCYYNQYGIWRCEGSLMDWFPAERFSHPFRTDRLMSMPTTDLMPDYTWERKEVYYRNVVECTEEGGGGLDPLSLRPSYHLSPRGFQR